MRLVFETAAEQGEWHGAVGKVARQLGIGAESLRTWVHREEIERGMRMGLTDAERTRLKELERENRELRCANEVRVAGKDTAPIVDAITAHGSNSYAYDDSDNRTQVVESGSGGPATTWNYCYDGLNRLRARQTTSACTVTSGDELSTYDDPGNRKTAPGNTFTYDNEGQLSGCTTGCGTVGHDATGRITSLNGWTFAYDAEGRMVSASGSNGTATFMYDGDGHRTSIAVTPSGQGTTTTNLRYQGDSVVEESVGGTVTRSYLTDEAGRIVKMFIPAGQPNPGTYLVTWNGHGDAMALWRVKVESDRTLEKANTFAYGTWGTPTTTFSYTNSATGSPYGDLGFRFLYVGASDVQWDNFGSLGLSLYYMHARHYSPTVGRFLQPDPAEAEWNLYAYANNAPVTQADPDGRAGIGVLCLVPVISWGCALVASAAVRLAITVIAPLVVRVGRTAGPAIRVTEKIAGTTGLRHAFDRHAAQWFGHAVSANRDLARWQELIERASRSRLVFRWSLGGEPTIAHLARFGDKWFVVQYWATGRRIGELAIAFKPSTAQLAAMRAYTRSTARRGMK